MAAEPDAIAKLIAAVDARQSFRLEAGAGSGKTFSLIAVLRHLLATQRTELSSAGRRIACITYTNAAKNEILKRIAEDPLVQVSTIHDFLWSLIEPHQPELRKELVEYNKTLSRPFEELDHLGPEVTVQYGDRARWFPDGHLHHDDVIKLAQRIVLKYPKLARIDADRYPYVFVDEFQDTFKETIDLLLNGLLAARQGRVVIGLFGDSMQNIYDGRVGGLNDERLEHITKDENFRSARPVVELLNKIRPQLPQRVMRADEGIDEVLLFVNATASSPEERLALAERQLTERGWSLSSAKRLYLTHRVIAENLQYPQLERLYSKRGPNGRTDLLEAREPYARMLSDITKLSRAFEGDDFATLKEMLGESKLKITRHSQKAEISADLRALTSAPPTESIGTVLDLALELGLVAKPRALQERERKQVDGKLDDKDEREVEFAKRLRDIPYQEWLNFVEFRDERTPYSTQHGVKGAEFDDVLVVVDDKAWNHYSMDGMISGTEKNPARLERSRNMFYVCCSRARRRLAVVFVSDLSPQAMVVARKWFGTENVFE